jgi:RNA polymerase sigma factor (sigma-70 family)
MRPPDDAELLTEYATRQSEDAFTELVGRNVALVYSAALRQVREPQLAEEVTQAVFIILARKAGAMSRHAHLSGWLCRVAYFVSRDALRAERRRQHRERILTPMENPADNDWTQIAPLLDEVVAQLNEKDRSAIVLRFYEQKSLGEVGAALGVDADAAQKRVSRALEKLRTFFTKRGVDSSAATIAGAISANSIQAVPAALAKTISGVALAKGATAPISTLTLIKGALKIMAWTKAKTAIVAGVVVLFAAGTTTVMVKTVHAIRAASPPDIQGSWEGVATILGASGMSPNEKARSRVVFQFFKTNGAYTATGVFIDTAPDPFQVANFIYDYPSVRFAVGQNFNLEGKLRAGANEIAATQRRGNVSVPMVLKRTAAPDAAPEPLGKAEYAPRIGSDLQGTWTAELGKSPVRLAVKIAEPSPGTFRAVLDNLSTSWVGQPVAVTHNSTEVKLQVVSGAGMFQGELRNGNTELVGNWIQGGGQSPVVFHRADR